MGTKRIDFLSYNDAREITRGLGFSCQREWKNYHKIHPRKIPSCPERTYKNKGWISWMDWLNTDNKKGGNRKYKVNDNFFKTWSSDMAYILGFWFADGHIGNYNGSYLFIIDQHKNDRYLLEKILKSMDSNYPIHYGGKDCYKFMIVSKEIYHDIINLGGKERKSLDVIFPKIPKEYLSDFIRGLWDGDGSVYLIKRLNKYGSAYGSSSKKFIDELYGILKESISELGGTISKYCSSSRENNANPSYHLSFGIEDTVKLKNFIYQNKHGLKLNRKYEKFLIAENVYLSTKREFLCYNDAQKIISKLGIDNLREWKQYCVNKSRPDNIPSHPEFVYKDLGWVDLPSWLGNHRRRKKKCSIK